MPRESCRTRAKSVGTRVHARLGKRNGDPARSAEDFGRSPFDPEAMKRFIRFDFQFHSTLVRAAANSRILKAVADTRVLLNVLASAAKATTSSTHPDSRLSQCDCRGDCAKRSP